MLIAVSGSQGSGKSTLLKALEDNDHQIITRKTSRSILSDWGVTLSDVNNDHSLTIKFQDEITKRKYEDEKEAIESSEIWFTERSHTDLFVYALVSLGKDNEYDDWLNEYYNTCLEYNQHYSCMIYLPAGFFDIEHDGVRGSNQHYSTMVDLIMEHYVGEMVTEEHPLAVINSGDLDTRVRVCESWVERVKRLTTPTS